MSCSIKANSGRICLRPYSVQLCGQCPLNFPPAEHHSHHAPPHPPHPPLVLATFETSGLDFLFPYPQLRPTYNSGVDVDLLMDPTREFPGVISPKVSFRI